VTAEGVETETQLRILEELGCDRAQGFLIARPVSAATLMSGLDGLLIPGEVPARV
jgi:EAL domain-containing protein (putative c-di-GMP-specific phosphodiesterase class I)